MKAPFRSSFCAAFLFLAPAANAASPGYIKIVQDKGVWWFIDGQGHKFFSKGVNCVGGCYGHAEPKPIEAARKQQIVSQLKGWGFNSAGNWSSPSVYDSLYVTDQIYHGVKGPENDVYAEALWTGNVYPHMADEIKPFVGRKNFVGYFVDNENKWDEQEVFKFYLGLPARSAGSLRLVDFLKRNFDADIHRLNTSFGTSYASFGSIPASPAPASFSAATRNETLKPWRTETAAYFYGRYVAHLRQLDPKHLVLGVRWAGFPDMALFKAVSAFMDVDSVNDYNRYGGLRPEYWEAYRNTKKPIIITEWSFSGYETPGKKSLQFIDVYSQKNRGIGYRKYVLEAARAPFMVGMHWFLWNDNNHNEVVKNGGYLPDENMGLVSNDGKSTYTELGQWIQRTNADLDHQHAASAQWTPFHPEIPRLSAPKAFPVKIDGDLSDWPAESRRPLQRLESIHDAPLPKHAYYLGMDKDQILIAADVDDQSLEETGPDWSWQSDNFSMVLLAEGAAAETKVSFQLHASGGGKNGRSPYAYRWSDAQSDVEKGLDLAVVKRPGGYRFEARFPAASLPKFPGADGSVWKISLAYEDIGGMNRAWWEGFVSLPKN
jgi:hypothetical protein